MSNEIVQEPVQSEQSVAETQQHLPPPTMAEAELGVTLTIYRVARGLKDIATVRRVLNWVLLQVEEEMRPEQAPEARRIPRAVL